MHNESQPDFEIKGHPTYFSTFAVWSSGSFDYLRTKGGTIRSFMSRSSARKAIHRERLKQLQSA